MFFETVIGCILLAIPVRKIQPIIMKNIIKKLENAGVEVSRATPKAAMYITLPGAKVVNGRRAYYEACGLIWPLSKQWETLGTATREGDLVAIFEKCLKGWTRKESPKYSDLVKDPEHITEFFSPVASGKS